MTRTTLARASAMLICVMLGLAIWLGIRLPADARLPIHWGASGEPDGFANKWISLMMPAAMVFLVSLLFYALPRLEPRKKGLERSESLYLVCWIAILFVFTTIEFVLVSSALGWPIERNRLIVAAIGLLFAAIGNQLGKSRRMYLVGIRTPWTLASEDVWIKTHRLGGKLMTLGGVVILAAALIPGLSPTVLRWAMLGVLAIVLVVPIAYSYLLWRYDRPGAGPSS